MCKLCECECVSCEFCVCLNIANRVCWTRLGHVALSPGCQLSPEDPHRGPYMGAVCLEARVPTLVVASARDRLLPSLAEAGRLVSLIPGALRVVLPDSGHTALLESSVHPRPLRRSPAVAASPGWASSLSPQAFGRARLFKMAKVERCG